MYAEVLVGVLDSYRPTLDQGVRVPKWGVCIPKIGGVRTACLYFIKSLPSFQTAQPSDIAPQGVRDERKHFNGWPNDSWEQTNPMQWKVSGKIPVYAAEVLHRIDHPSRNSEE